MVESNTYPPILPHGHILKAYANAAYLQTDDSLRLGVFNAATGVTVALSGLLLNEVGELIPVNFPITPTTNRAETVLTISIGEGWLVHAAVQLVAGSPLRGQTFVTARIVRGSLSTSMPTIVLFSDYVTPGYQPSFPNSPPKHALDGPGAIRSITGTDPAAGVEISETVPTGARWNPLAIEMTLVASAAVANRRVSLRLDDGANEYYKVEGNSDVTASQTRVFSVWQTSQPASGNNVTFYLPIPTGLRMLAGHRIRTVTSGLDAGDNWGAPQLLVEEWLEA